MSSSMLFRSLCRHPSILFKSPHVQRRSHVTKIPPLRKVTVEWISTRNPYLDYDSNDPIIEESDPRIHDPEAGNHFHRFRWLSAPVFKDTFYFIEQQHELIIQGIIMDQKHGGEKYVKGACSLDRRGEDTTHHLEKEYNLGFEHFDKITSGYMARNDWKAGSFFIVIDEMQMPDRSRGAEPGTVAYMQRKRRSVAWRVEHDWQGVTEDKSRFDAKVAIRSWIEKDKLSVLYDGTLWTRRLIRNLAKWKKVREALVRVGLRKSLKGKH